MNTKQLIIYIEEQTGRRLHGAAVSRYIADGWLKADKSGPGVAVRYDTNAADELVRRITSIGMIEAAALMSERLGWNVTTGRIKKLCQGRKVIYLGNPYRIPVDALYVLQEQLIISRGIIPKHVADAIMARCMDIMDTKTEIARRSGYSLSMISRVADGNRGMSPRLYDKLLAISGE